MIIGTDIDWSYPRLLLVGLVATLTVTLLVTAGTSSASLGAYNPQWDGTSQVRSEAERAGSDPTIVQNVSAYETATANQTIAVVLSPDESYSDGESQAIESFVRAGGTLLVAEDYGPHGNQLLGAIGAEARVTGIPLRDEQRLGPSPAFARTTPRTNHIYTEGVNGVMLNHGSSVTPGNATSLFVSSEFSYLDRNRNEELDEREVLQQRPVVTLESLGDGTVITVSDPSVFLNSMAERSDNRGFTRTPVGSHQSVLLDVSHTEGVPPLVSLQLFLQDSSLAAFVAAAVSVLFVFVIGQPLGLAERVQEWRGQQDTEPELTSEEIATTIQAQHPDWDESRIERVTTSLMEARGKEKRDD